MSATDETMKSPKSSMSSKCPTDCEDSRHLLSFTGTFYIGTFKCRNCRLPDNFINRGAYQCSKCPYVLCKSCKSIVKIPRIKSVTFGATPSPKRMISANSSFQEEQKTNVNGATISPRGRVTNPPARRASPRPRPKIKRAQSSTAFSVIPGRVSILVSDLSGFTRSTRKYGIVHFGSIIIRMRQLVRPIFSLFECESVEYEGDDCIVVFPNEIAAVRAATFMKYTLEAYNKSLPASHKHFSIILGGIGLANGEGIIKDFYGHLYGPGADLAFELGEELAEKEILLSPDFYEVLKQNLDNVADLEIIKKDGCEEECYTIRGNLEAFNATSSSQLPQPFADLDDPAYIGNDLCLFTSRFTTDDDITKTDILINEQYLRPATILFFKFNLPEHTLQYGQRNTLDMVHTMLAVLKPIFLKHGAIKVETWMRLFSDEESAVKCACDVQKTIFEFHQKHSQNGSTNHNLDLCGFGIHSGEIVYVEDTDVHWGDPVNTASKLGEDLAENGEILLSKKVYLRAKAVITDKKITKRNLTVSKVDFEAYSLTLCL